MEYAAGLIKLKSSSEEKVENWRAVFESKREEALQTLRAEGAVVESWFQVSIENQPYLLWYMRAESMAKVWRAFEESNFEIDQFHLKTMSSISETNISATPLLDLSLHDPDTLPIAAADRANRSVDF